MYDKETLNKAQEGVSYVLERTKEPLFSDHAKARLRERDITKHQVTTALLFGRVVEGHKPFHYPRGPQSNQNVDPVFTFHLPLSDRTLCVAVAVKMQGGHAKVWVVTVYWK